LIDALRLRQARSLPAIDAGLESFVMPPSRMKPRPQRRNGDNTGEVDFEGRRPKLTAISSSPPDQVELTEHGFG
jgi:hypothetical protein